MRRQDLLSLLITFVVGMCIGAYLYITGAANFFAELSTPTVEETNDFSIVGDIYGGCRAACPSFQLLEDGSYRHLYTPERGADEVLQRGTIPFSLRQNLRSTLTRGDLEAQAKAQTRDVCNSHSDGIDVSYAITIDGDTYKLDSCTTAVDGDGALWIYLNQIWEHINNTK